MYRSKINGIINENGKKLEEDREIANELNDHFANVEQRLASLITQTPKKAFQEAEVMATIFLEPTSKDEIYKIIIELKNNCSPGHDKIIKKDLIMLYDIVGEKVVELINEVLINGIYPEELKTAKIIPIYKKGSHDDVNNYRPISLPNVFSKLLET